MTTTEEAWTANPHDAEWIDPYATRSRCRRNECRAPIWWGTTKANKKLCPFDIKPDGTRTGTSHWRTCLDRPEKRR